MKGRLFLVSTPIGNYEDITLRAIRVLKDADFIICEEFKEARRLLSHLNISKELYALNEHNEDETSEEMFGKILQGKNAALISDCGTPIFSDPGSALVNLCIQANVDVIPVPGANSLLTALVGSGFELNKFYYAGWLSPKKDLRRQELYKLKSVNEIIVLMETPYRLIRILEDVSSIFKPNTNAVLAFELTTKDERFFRGSIAEVFKIAAEKKLKGEFVLVIDNRK